MAILIAAMAVGRAHARPPAEADLLAYTVSPEFDADGLSALDVTLRFAADAVGPTRLELPDKAAGVSGLWRYVAGLRIEGARRVETAGPAMRLIEAAPGAPIVVSYRLISAFDHNPATPEIETYKPVIRPGWFWTYGEALFARPEGGERRATFRWTGAARFPFESDLQHAGGGPMSLHDLFESVLIGGPDVILVHRTVGDAPVRIAVVGKYDFTDESFADAASRIIAGERAFWGGREGPFLVAMAALTPVEGHTSTRGEGRGDAFAIQTSANARLDVLKAMIAHEYFHTWDPRRLGGIEKGPAGRASYWFSEGFTDFYARRLLLRMGIYDLRAFVRDWNEMLQAYAVSGARGSPGGRVLLEFWTNREVEKLPYQRGAMLAAIWDRRLRLASHGTVGLDVVMHAMRQRAASAGPRSPNAPDLFVETAAQFGLDVRADLARFIGRGEPILLPADVFGDCLTVRTSTVHVFDPGFAIASEGPPYLVTSVKEGSPAYAAGLRQGMRILRREAGVYGDSRIPYRLKVLDGEAERTISFLPEGARIITLQELVIAPGLSPERRQACEAGAGV